ncbi:MAG: glycosyltransferase family 2 protein [Candidatus Binatia bacterium]
MAKRGGSSEVPVHNPAPLVTIAIPTHNRASSYLPLALASALAQGYANLEVLVADNASTDATAELMRGIADPRLRYTCHRSNIGPNRNYNYCLAQARGDYFLLLQDDDLIDPDFVETCMHAAGRDAEVGLIRTGIRVIDDHGDLLRESRNQVSGCPLDEFFLGWFAGRTSWYVTNTLFHTGRLKQIGGFHSKYQVAEDGFAIAQVAARWPRVDVEEIRASFRVHRGEGTFRSKVLDWGEEYLSLLDCLCQLVTPDKTARVRREGRRFFARLTYNRAAAIENPLQRMRAYAQVFRLFRYRYLPGQHLASVRLFRRQWRQMRQRAAQALNQP